MAIDSADLDQATLQELRALVAAQQAELNALRFRMDALQGRLAAYDDEYARNSPPGGPRVPLRTGMVYHPPMRDPETIQRALDAAGSVKLTGPWQFRRFMEDDDDEEASADAGD